MKKLSRTKSIVVSIIILIIVLVGAFFAFVPFRCGTKDYASFLGNVAVSNDLKGGLYADYKITSISTEEEIKSSVVKLREILSDEGFVNSDITLVGEDLLHVEIRGANNSFELSEIKSVLEAIGGGAFEIRAGDDAKVKNILYGSEHIKNVSISSSGTYYYVIINLNKEGTQIYEELTKESIDAYSGKVYMYMGDTAWPSSSANYFTVSSVVTNGQIALSLTSLDYAKIFAMNIKCGSLGIELDNESIEIAELSPKTTNNFFLVSCIILLALVIGLFVLFILMYKVGVVSFAVSFLIDIIIGLFFMQAIPWVEIDIASLATIFVVIIAMFTNFSIIMNIAKNEYKNGKTFEASMSQSYRKGVKITCDFSIIPFMFGLVSAILGFGTIRSIGVIMIIYSLLNMLTNTLLVNWFNRLLGNIFEINAGTMNMKKEEKVDETSK